MVFSSPIFVFGFLPVALLLYFVSPARIRNVILLVLSLAFYAWGEVFYVGIMLVSIASNFVFGKLIGNALEKESDSSLAKTWITLGVAVNLALLIAFKYANFIADNVNTVLGWAGVPPVDLEPVHLPLGISFFTFQAISYIVDVYRREVKAQHNVFDLALYISLFPQLIAGPIVRYHDVAAQIFRREHSVELFASGVQRFIIGLSKKMLIANPMGEVADNVFAMSSGDLTMPIAWIGILAYTLQIYFDFSGYSDMAIGLGRMFGFRFLENFNYPYISRNIREFWRRWHISLSTWFRDYVYIPLGGSRVSKTRVYMNLLVVFLLTGIWHGASWNFVVWGLFHGFFITIEHMGFSRILERLWAPVQHVYLLLVVVVGWVFFRADNLSLALEYLSQMFNFSNWSTTEMQYRQVVTKLSVYVFVLGMIFSLPLKQLGVLWQGKVDLPSPVHAVLSFSRYSAQLLAFSLLMYLCMLKIASSTYNPFIYFRF